jgi:putative spermidine/putrescine transport system ATP-binding protein
MADRVAVFNQGRLEQFAAPSTIYDQPASLFVNTFVGAANVLKGTVTRVNGGSLDLELNGGSAITGRAMQDGLVKGDAVAVCLRPEQLRRAASGLAGTIEITLPLGASTLYEVRLTDGSSIKVSEQRDAGNEAAVVGQSVFIAPSHPECVNVFRQV